MKNDLETLIEPEPKSSILGSSNICPDYDDECVLVPDPLFCWMGTKNCDSLNEHTGMWKQWQVNNEVTAGY
jgi:hypothetical protein